MNVANCWQCRQDGVPSTSYYCGTPHPLHQHALRTPAQSAQRSCQLGGGNLSALRHRTARPQQVSAQAARDDSSVSLLREGGRPPSRLLLSTCLPCNFARAMSTIQKSHDRRQKRDCSPTGLTSFEPVTVPCSAALQPGSAPVTDTAYQEGAEYLRSLGIDNQGELMRILDVAMNPNSLFGRYRDKKRAISASVSTYFSLRLSIHYYVQYSMHIPWDVPCVGAEERSRPLFESVSAV